MVPGALIPYRDARSEEQLREKKRTNSFIKIIFFFGLKQNREEHNIYIEGKNFLEPSTGCVTSTSQVWRFVIGECIWCD